MEWQRHGVGTFIPAQGRLNAGVCCPVHNFIIGEVTMLNIRKIDHVGIRINDIETSMAFYQSLGFEKTLDAGFKDGSSG